ncbi:MAG: WGR domain-containing protein [Bacteroidia bacterium]
MKLIKQIKLSFREGNSDKVYEIDLCEAGTDKYLVNFRFGRRGANLNEGTKTVNPVDLAQAEKIFKALETEKRKKGYADDVAAEIPSFQEVHNTVKAPNEKAILNRLAAEASGTTLTLKSKWEISRVVWRAGELRLEAALPYLLRIETLWNTQKNKELQLYSLLWALGRLQKPEAINVLALYFSNDKNSHKIRRIAGEGLFHILKEEEKTQHQQHYLNRLPEELKKHIEQGQWEQVNSLVRAKMSQQKQKEYGFLTALYSLSMAYPQLKHTVVSTLQHSKFTPPYFRSIRHIFKLAEFREDAEVMGLISYRFDSEAPTFNIRPKKYWESPADYEKHSTYDYQLRAYIQPVQELRKPDSKLAYSNKTKRYLLSRAARTLKKAGTADSLYYVKLATAILCSYDKSKDYVRGYSENRWPRWNRWNRVSIEHPEYYNRYFLNYILYGNREGLKWSGRLRRNSRNSSHFASSAVYGPWCPFSFKSK